MDFHHLAMFLLDPPECIAVFALEFLAKLSRIFWSLNYSANVSVEAPSILDSYRLRDTEGC